MLQFYQMRGWRAALRSWWAVGALVLVCVFLLTAVWQRATIENDMQTRRAALEAEAAALEAEKATLTEKVEYLKSERGQEAEMRRNFDVAQPGEQVVIILDETSTSTIEPILIPVRSDAPWWQFWRD